MPDIDDIRATLARIPNPIAVLESLFALAPIGLQIYESSGRSLLVNQAFLDLFGSEPPPGYNVLKDEIAERTGQLALIHRAFAGETVQLSPTWYDPRELTQVKVEQANRAAIQATFFPLFDRQGKVSHVAVVFKDLTAELVHREQLEAERELLSSIVDQVADGIVMADAEGIIRLVNRAARALGVRPGLRPQRWSEEMDLVDKDGAQLSFEVTPLWQALQGQTAAGLVRFRSRHGLRAVAASAVPLRAPDGRPRGAVMTTRDETERERLEAEAQQTAIFRERFIGILGHDLRSPLTSIKASAAFIHRHRGLPPQVGEAAERIERSGERMTRMISDVLDFTQARLGGGLSVSRQRCDLRTVADTVAAEVQSAHPERLLLVTAEGETAGRFDPDRTAQLLSNLLQNAVAYSPAEEPIEVHLAGTPEAVEISVANRGPPIDEAEQQILFDPFRRGAGRRDAKGLGLGLFIVQQIARAHDGEVRVESREGRTCFRARLQR